jgi:hypothetical protein
LHRHVALIAALLLVLVACTDGEDEPPTPVEEENDDEDEERPPQGLRVGVVLPPKDTGTADEIQPDALGLDDMADRLDEEVSELRTLVPDSASFVEDLTTVLAVEGYDLVCVFGRQAREAVVELASRHGATTFCAAPVGASEDLPDNVLPVDLALEELGHVVGVALSSLGGRDPVALLGAGNRAGGEAFRSGLRAGVGGTPLREARGDLDELGAELDAAVADEVAAIALDAGPDARELVVDDLGVPLLAPAPLLEEEAGALRWRLRWDVVLERVIAWHLDGDEDGPGRLGVQDGVFEVQHGPQARPRLVAAVEAAMGELERGERDPLDSRAPGDRDDGDGDEDDGADEDDD